MITSLFLPERIGSYYLLARRIVGIEITKHALMVTVILLKGRSRVIETVLTERIGTERSYDEQVVQALQSLKVKLGKYDEIYCSIPSSNIIFKELSLPFIGPKKIKIVIPFEVESQLPFNLEDAVVDSIVTGVNTEEQKTDVLVAATKREVVARYAGYFQDAELPLDKMSVGIFELYSLYTTLPGYQPATTSALIEIGSTETTIGLMVHGRLKYVRTIQKGLRPKDAQQETPFDKPLPDDLASILEDSKLTTDAALQKIAPGSLLNTVVLTGTVTDIQDQSAVHQLTDRLFGCPVELLDPKRLITSHVCTSKVSSVPGMYMPTIALACAPEKTDSFTLLQEKAQEKENQHITYQLITAGALTLALFTAFVGYSFFRVRALKKTYKTSEQQAIAELQKQFKLRSTQTKRLDIANKAAQAELQKQETAWKRLSTENRYAYVTYLAELTKCINMKESQLQLESIIFKDDTIKLYGSVPGYQQLTRLQDQLNCPLFKKVTKLQAFNFKSEPITLVINREAFNAIV